MEITVEWWNWVFFWIFFMATWVSGYFMGASVTNRQHAKVWGEFQKEVDKIRATLRATLETVERTKDVR